MMPGLSMGLGLGLTNNANSPVPSVQDLLCTAIKERKHVVATVNGIRAVIQPYGIFRTKDGPILEAVPVISDGGTATFRIIRPAVSCIKNVKISDVTFVPNSGFGFGPRKAKRAIAVVDQFESVEDFLEAHSG